MACGDGPDEERASNHFSIPFQKINSPQDLYAVPGLLSKEYDIPVPDKYFPRTETSSTNSPLSKKTTQNKIVTFDKGLLSDCHKKLVLYTSDLKKSKKCLRETAEVEDNIIVEAKTSQ